MVAADGAGAVLPLEQARQVEGVVARRGEARRARSPVHPLEAYDALVTAALLLFLCVSLLVLPVLIHVCVVALAGLVLLVLLAVRGSPSGCLDGRAQRRKKSLRQPLLPPGILVIVVIAVAAVSVPPPAAGLVARARLKIAAKRQRQR